jgi:two-component system, cell cycle response regulator CpdR
MSQPRRKRVLPLLPACRVLITQTLTFWPLHSLAPGPFPTVGCEMSVESSSPATDGPYPTSTAPGARPTTILVAEDDEAVRTFVRAVLEQAGFAVETRPDGRAAGDLFAADPNRFDLLLTDVIMPHATGVELAARVRQIRPDLPVLFMSAFTGGAGLIPEPLPPHEALVEKPFTVATLLEAIRGLLDGR